MWKRFRFSLLSLLVGVLLTGGVGWLNVRTRKDFTATHAVTVERHSFGWPFTARLEDFVVTKAQNTIDRFPEWRWPGLVANIAIGLAIVFCGAGACEYVVRRRGKKAET